MKSTSILESHKNAQENVCASYILMIDDDEMMRILFRDTFWIHAPSHQPIDVATVRSIPDAKAYLKETKSQPDVIFMGLWLLVENSDGSSTREADPSIEFIQQLRKDSAYKKTPIVVYSRYSDPA
jgi:CheY-like chemotaxis protein